MFRSTDSTGFRAPSLWKLMRNKVKPTLAQNITTLSFVQVVIGTSPQYQTECNIQFYRMQGGNPDLQPEESKTFTAGFVYEPIKNLVFSC